MDKRCRRIGCFLGFMCRICLWRCRGVGVCVWSGGCKPKPAEFVQFAKRVDPAVESRPHLPSWKERPLSTGPVLAVVRLALVSENICFTTRYVQLPNCLKMASRNVRKTLSQTDHVRKQRLYGFATPFVSVYFRTNMHTTLQMPLRAICAWDGLICPTGESSRSA
jgi:hypothetical protein